ncbi:hypothetical protein K503DRAFT_391281 [Rhizopogon vinicolor AM-OR11-026]|uniref:Uncharacterized protein n=1 Tax=Rhizopogon vinicolor AM-OR11-026 TaxID=1314800 RepID=A0A1B7MRH8_9AGAM|nr:hypothetical protein K503DRAFT_391281 [Rhizopogon vinicolor AM-OR11-026]
MRTCDVDSSIRHFTRAHSRLHQSQGSQGRQNNPCIRLAALADPPLQKCIVDPKGSLLYAPLTSTFPFPSLPFPSLPFSSFPRVQLEPNPIRIGPIIQVALKVSRFWYSGIAAPLHIMISILEIVACCPQGLGILAFISIPLHIIMSISSRHCRLRIRC